MAPVPWQITPAATLQQAQACYYLSQRLSLTSQKPQQCFNQGFLLARETLGEYEHACVHGSLWLALDSLGAMAGYMMAWRVGPGESGKNPLAAVAWQGEAPPAVHAPWVYVDKVAVAPEYQRCGVGQALYRAVPPRLLGHPAPAVGAFVVHTPVRNEASVRFHQRLGFALLAEGEEGGYWLGFYGRGERQEATS